MVREKSADERFCISCGNTIKQQAELCPHCGTRTESASTSTKTTSSRSSTSSHKSSSFDVDFNRFLDAIGPYVSWFGGLFLLLMALAALTDGGNIIFCLISSVVFISGSILLIPSTREQVYPLLQDYGVNIRFTRAQLIGIGVFALFAGSMVASSA